MAILLFSLTEKPFLILAQVPLPIVPSIMYPRLDGPYRTTGTKLDKLGGTELADSIVTLDSLSFMASKGQTSEEVGVVPVLEFLTRLSTVGPCSDAEERRLSAGDDLERWALGAKFSPSGTVFTVR